MLRRDTDGIVTYHFENLAAQGVFHAVFTRLGGASRGPFAALNVGNSVGDDEAAVAENHARVYARLDLIAAQVTTPHQVHGNRVAVVSGSDAGRLISNTDGLATMTPGVALLLRFADCQPILLYDPEHHALALIHAGWRGVAQGIARRAIETMQATFGTRPQYLVVGLGPAIGPCCYTVGHNVAAAMGYALPDWQQAMHLQGEDVWRLDLSAANLQQLAAAGIQKNKIEQAGLCTSCRNDEFFSHRADGGKTGRFAVVAYLEPRAGARETEGAEGVPAEAGVDDSFPVDALHPPGFPAFGEVPGAEG